MTKDKWLNIVDMVEGKFGIEEDYKEALGDDVPGEKHVIEFNGPMGKIKLEWIEKARLKDVKTLYSDRIGSGVKVNKVYDEEDQINYMNAYKWDEAGEKWKRINAEVFEEKS